MSYLTEFSLDWRPEFHPIPDEVLALVAAGEAVDMSWHNDVCPSFGIEVMDGDSSLRLWVDAVSVNDRECGNETRFTVCLDDGTVLVVTDDVAAAVACYRENLPKYRAATCGCTDASCHNASRCLGTSAEHGKGGLCVDCYAFQVNAGNVLLPSGGTK